MLIILWSKGANVSIPAKRGKVQDTSVILMVIITLLAYLIWVADKASSCNPETLH